MKQMLLILSFCLGTSYLFWAPSCQASPTGLHLFELQWSGDWQAIRTSPRGAYRLTSSTSDKPSFVELSFDQPQNFRKHFFQIQARVADMATWSGVELRLSSDESFENYFAIAVPYYSDLEFNILQSNQWADLSFTLGEAQVVGSPDIENISQLGFYIQAKGEKPLVLDLARFRIQKAIHNAIVSLTFDDGYVDHFIAAKVMAKHQLRGTAYIMPDQIGDQGYLSQDQIKTMGTTWGWGISSHHETPITHQSHLASVFDQVFSFFEQLTFPSFPSHFAYPLGKQSREKTLPLMRERFLSARIAGGGAETLPPADWHMLKTFNVTPNISPEKLIQRVQLAQNNNEWLILMFHKFVDDPNPTDPLDYNLDKFAHFCELLKQLDIPVQPVHEVYHAFH